MQRWFGEAFDIIFAAVDQQQLRNPWERCTQVIASIDYAKQPDVRERIWQQRWDLVIIDEAHKCSARTKSGGAGRGPQVEPTRRHELAVKLSEQTDHLLLMTATPHHGDEDKFAHFLRLIDPDLFAEPHRMGEEATDLRGEVFRLGADCPWMLRRLKEDLKDMDGQRLFPDRHAVTVPFTLNSEEFALYKAVTGYINQFIPQQQGQRKTSAALARTVWQCRLASSACAIHESLKRRVQKQPLLLDELEALPPAQRSRKLAALQRRLVDAERDEDDLDDADRDVLLDVLHRVLWLMENSPRKLAEFLDEARPDRERLRVLAQALAGAALSGKSEADAAKLVTTTTAEQSALNKLLANWRSLIEEGVAAAVVGKKAAKQDKEDKQRRFDYGRGTE